MTDRQKCCDFYCAHRRRCKLLPGHPIDHETACCTVAKFVPTPNTPTVDREVLARREKEGSNG